MKKDQVPQDNSKIYQGQSKLVYAVDEMGHYAGVKSSGWDVESFATQYAVDDLNQQAEDTLAEVQQGKVSALKYHMLCARHDVLSLSQVTGFFQWQIKRHFKPRVFNTLSAKALARYCEALAITEQQLKEIPEQHDASFKQPSA
ncbi:hypothetical protein [Pseudoalteromonas spongiae]|uniref:hypothetical protein n=1 Tax=Pseudoalteromonas spongiae TaxID=298657 RepID=UPI003735FCF3